MKGFVLKDQMAVIVLAREPILGWGKTRLQKDLSQQDVLQCYQSFLKDILDNISQTNFEGKFVFYATQKDHGIPFLETYTHGFDIIQQGKGALGDKMLHALHHVADLGYQKIIMVGSDCVTITEDDYHHVEKILDEKNYVLGPTFDGGYYLIAMRDVDDVIFQDIDWSTEHVLSQTQEKICLQKYSCELLDFKMDVDDIHDLKKIAEALDFKRCPETYKMLNVLGL